MLRDILLMQKREAELRLQERYVPRECQPREAPADLIKVVLGPRRAGKSFLALRLAQAAGKFGYVNFDDERLERLGDYDALVAAVDAVYDQPRYLLLDEIQNLPRWELFVNRLQRQGYDLIVTGSNAHLLSSELATHLTGRHVPIVVFPFSFAETLRTEERELTGPEQAEALRRYAETGGYPEPLIKGIDHHEYLRTLLRSTLYKDIVVRRRIRSAQGLDDLATYLLSNTARDYSCRRLAQAAGIGSIHTVQKYLRHLEEAFLLFSIRRFSFKVREQMRANPKVYGIDNGLVTAGSFRSSSERGRLYENLVAIALRRQQLEGRLECYYWKGAQQEEVDFVVKQGRRVTRLLQVCADVSQPKTRDREVRALLKASEALGCQELLVLTDGVEAQEEASWFGSKGTIQYQPLWKWLLSSTF